MCGVIFNQLFQKPWLRSGSFVIAKIDSFLKVFTLFQNPVLLRANQKHLKGLFDSIPDGMQIKNLFRQFDTSELWEVSQWRGFLGFDSPKVFPMLWKDTKTFFWAASRDSSNQNLGCKGRKQGVSMIPHVFATRLSDQNYLTSTRSININGKRKFRSLWQK